MTPDLEDSRAVKLQSLAAQDFIPLFSGRPKREKVIGRDDLVDLDILLHTCDTVEAFLAKA
jgi:hypothetical protein